jgi:hypothetical protein
MQAGRRFRTLDIVNPFDRPQWIERDAWDPSLIIGFAGGGVI